MTAAGEPPQQSASSGYFEGERMEVLWRHAYRPEFVQLLMDYLGVRPGSSVLDVGCGTGFLSRLIARSLPEVTVVGVDTDERSLEIGREMVTSEGLEGRVELVTGDAFDLGFPGEHFDTVTSQTLL